MQLLFQSRKKRMVVGKCEESILLDLFFLMYIVGKVVKKIKYAVNSEP